MVRCLQADGVYNGDLVNGVREGKGTLVWPNGDRCVFRVLRALMRYCACV